ncbi:MAG: MFS transporter [Nocardiopsaceae bacterium]|nr:MFS transporter [Nocardiopsaceae bacterium]
MKLLTDVTPLRQNPAFRRLWLGSIASGVGTAMTSFAMTLQAWDITRSTAAVGGLGVATLVPMLVVALPGGTLADRVDRRKLVLAVTAGQAVFSALLFAQAAAGLRSLWLLYALAAAVSASGAISQPARQTFVPKLVPAGQLTTAMALGRIVFQVMMTVGPGLAGVVTAAVGVRGCYLVDAASFAGAFYGVGQLPAMRPDPIKNDASRAERSGLALTVEGLTCVWRDRILAGTFLADLNATFFALPLSLFPAINALRFGGDPRTLGLFTTAIGVGGMVTAVASGPLARMPRRGLAMLVTVSAWGAAFAVFAASPWLWLTLLALAAAGAADSFTVVIRGVIVQTVTPDELRGRVSAADYVIGAGGPQLGSLESGLLASVTSPVASAVAGGLLTIAGSVAIGAALPAFRRYRDTATGAVSDGVGDAVGESA